MRPGQGTEDTRRIASRAEIDELRWATVTRLADARLVVTQRDEGSGEDIAGGTDPRVAAPAAVGR